MQAYDELEAAARLAAEDVGFFCDKAGVLVFCLLCNNHFVPAADSEEVQFSEAPRLLWLYRKDGHAGLMKYIAAKRGVENKRWR